MNTKILSTLLAVFTLALPTFADNAMNGMGMGGMKMSRKPSAAPLSVTATINPTAPQTGDNALELMITGPDGKPATDLKLTTTVAMTSMDMGTTHPAVTETGNGHYTAKITFAMDGPWRVVVRNSESNLAVLDFNAGSKTPWKFPALAAPSATPMADMKTGIADIKTAVVSHLQEMGTYTATGDEDWKQQTGFGHNAPMIGMMNQMMVGGSGMEGMKMPAMKMDFGPSNYTKPEGEDSASAGSMAGMDMSGSKASIPSDNKPAAQSDSMAGMKMDVPAPVAATPPNVTATINAPKTGDNALQITLMDSQGHPVTDAKIAATVAMTSMDMGTTHPAVTQKGNGKYTSTVNFNMAGPWRVKLTVTVPGQKTQSKSFDFNAK